ncbi:hypothetical protein H5410_000648 [Solanum commersonii]|uniref:Uncharacterized protein n=1 Tax=Solanum commersonii TaxID=4109 RepID=A0A9J6AXJ6_SOLCO|nr:hypothetical protein H5410_000648 [Solanum commersonii]
MSLALLAVVSTVRSEMQLWKLSTYSDSNEMHTILRHVRHEINPEGKPQEQEWRESERGKDSKAFASSGNLREDDIHLLSTSQFCDTNLEKRKNWTVKQKLEKEVKAAFFPIGNLSCCFCI